MAAQAQRKTPHRVAKKRLPPALAIDRGPANIDPAQVASIYHWDDADQRKLAFAIFAAMKVAFEARWVELGLAGVPVPPAAVRHLRELSNATAQNATRTHNTQVARFVATWLTTYANAHDGSTAGAHNELIDATGKWLAARVVSHGAALSSFQTLLAHSFADLYSASNTDLFTVDGPALTEASCPTCVQWFGRVLTPEQAWKYVFPAHPNCEHVLRRLSPNEATRVRAQGGAR